MRDRLSDIDEPTDAELAAIENEWPLIVAELDLMEAELDVLDAAERGGPFDLDWQRLRRAEARVLREAAALVDRVARPRHAA
ncbi:hypothetical protein J2S43_006813 [Catenuloplanes nepalensis]|uniref:Uncharacterized protein n=1 Tax=Catenuloplanes nepalensis TaxID=587533 RepID=A0ABT9N4F6_9ACTN|nr:DUF6284 family protein [Catenuloplanes nepalensis]MDP9798301.1 hypothetical protein [Catenuloplanes nepalensis]